jgi:hypothetical protein
MVVKLVVVERCGTTMVVVVAEVAVGGWRRRWKKKGGYSDRAPAGVARRTALIPNVRISEGKGLPAARTARNGCRRWRSIGEEKEESTGRE